MAWATVLMLPQLFDYHDAKHTKRSPTENHDGGRGGLLFVSIRAALDGFVNVDG